MTPWPVPFLRGKWVHKMTLVGLGDPCDAVISYQWGLSCHCPCSETYFLERGPESKDAPTETSTMLLISRDIGMYAYSMHITWGAGHGNQGVVLRQGVKAWLHMLPFHLRLTLPISFHGTTIISNPPAAEPCQSNDWPRQNALPFLPLQNVTRQLVFHGVF